MKSKSVAISAPSGGGKTTIIKKLFAKHHNCILSISATTRAPRKGERHGIDYYFISENEFEEMIKNDLFLEYEKVHDNYYGTPKSELEKLKRGEVVLFFDVDVKGALNIKKTFPETLLLFIAPPSIEELRNRLKKRKTDSAAVIEKRLARAEMELKEAEKFDYIVINDHLNKAVAEIESIIFYEAN